MAKEGMREVTKVGCWSGQDLLMHFDLDPRVMACYSVLCVRGGCGGRNQEFLWKHARCEQPMTCLLVQEPGRQRPRIVRATSQKLRVGNNYSLNTGEK